MRVLVTGASGFLGRHLVAGLVKQRHEVLRLTQGPADSADPRLRRWEPSKGWIEPGALEGLDAVVHLAGEPVAGKRWSEIHKQKVRDSRVQGTRLLIDALAQVEKKPKALICASAVGIYGDRGDELLDESSASGGDFLASVCRDWEAEALRAEDLGIRCAQARLGMVLGMDGGALKMMLLPFRLGLGGRLGSGRQWMSWISSEDAVRALIFLIEQPGARGPFNLTAPNPCTNAQFTISLGRALARPAFFWLPAFVLRLALGEMADAMLLGGQKALPLRLKQMGFTWGSPYIGEALNKALPQGL